MTADCEEIGEANMAAFDAPSVGGVTDRSSGLTPCAATAVPYVSRLPFLSPRPACSETLDLGPEEIRKFLKV